MKIKSIYPFFTNWLILNVDNELYILSETDTELVHPFEETILHIANICHSSCKVYCESAFYYVNLITFVCVKKEKKQSNLDYLGTLNTSWDIFNEKNEKCLFAYNNKTGKHCCVNHKKKHWTVRINEDKLVLIEADEYGLYIDDEFVHYPNDLKLSIKKLQEVGTNILLHGINETKHVLLMYCNIRKNFSVKYTIGDIENFQIISNVVLLFYEGFFTILDFIDVYIYDEILNISDTSIIFSDEKNLYRLSIKNKKVQHYVIDYKIKNVCENQNQKLLVIKEDDSFFFV
tara:strand:+ start:5728 stop:6591 length:864 start_codon:yes stop_codon:yes gene_type:complete